MICWNILYIRPSRYFIGYSGLNYRCGDMGRDLYGVLLLNVDVVCCLCSERDLAEAYSSPITGAYPEFFTTSALVSFMFNVVSCFTTCRAVVCFSHVDTMLLSFYSVPFSNKPFLDTAKNNKITCILQPPPPVNDTNPFNVFRPREKIHRPHTRRVTILFISDFFILCVSYVI